MAFVDEDLFSVAADLVPLDALVKRLRALQYDHLVDTPEILQEVGTLRATVDSTLKRLPDDLFMKYSRLYAELEWAVASLVFFCAESESSREGSLYRLLNQ